MTTRQKIVAGAALILVTLPATLPARSAEDLALPEPPDNRVISPESPPGFDPSGNFPKLTVEKSGILPTKDGGILRVNVELGDVRVITDESGKVSYHATVEADSRDPHTEEFLKRFRFEAQVMPWGIALDAKVPWRAMHGRFNAAVEIHIPRRYNLEVETGGGSIDVQNIDGRVNLRSAGGDINVGRVGGGDGSSGSVHPQTKNHDDRLKPVLIPAARIETLGGHITVGDVSGTLRAKTLGGHITTGNISGDAVLRTGGGQIAAGSIAGAATLDSGGGSIHIESAGGSVTAETAGGGIVFRQAGVPLRVFANSGSITAWLNGASGAFTSESADGRKPRNSSELASTNGDIIVYLPREMAATIDALVEGGNERRIVADPSLPVKIHYSDSADGARTIHCEGELNGGGDVLHLKSVSGNIALRLCDPRVESAAAHSGDRAQSGPGLPLLQPVNSPSNAVDNSEFPDPSEFFSEIRRRIQESWWGGIPVDADEMQKHLAHSVAPVYPDVARRAGIEGNVVLRVFVSPSGRVTDLKVLEGPPILARAAAEAVQQWEYHSVHMNGRPASVVTTLVVSFRLH